MLSRRLFLIGSAATLASASVLAKIPIIADAKRVDKWAIDGVAELHELSLSNESSHPTLYNLYVAQEKTLQFHVGPSGLLRWKTRYQNPILVPPEELLIIEALPSGKETSAFLIVRKRDGLLYFVSYDFISGNQSSIPMNFNEQTQSE